MKVGLNNDFAASELACVAALETSGIPAVTAGPPAGKPVAVAAASPAPLPAPKNLPATPAVKPDIRPVLSASPKSSP